MSGPHEEHKGYETYKGNLLSLSLLSIPGHSELSPYGMNKFTHLNDGCLDVMLVKGTSKKEFVRYLRRHGNQKDQVSYHVDCIVNKEYIKTLMF